MALKTRMWSAGKVLVLAGALLATYALFAAVSMRIALRTREVVVPDLRGRSVNEATALLAERGVKLRVEEPRRLDPKVPADHILSQEPAAGLPIRRQRSVKVWVSAGARVGTPPSVAGQPVRAAETRLRQDGFASLSFAEIRTGEYPAESVVSQEASDAASGRVALLVNRGERGATYVMPDLIGVNGERAAEVLRARGFRVAVVGHQPYPGVPAGVVIRQSPQGGFQIAPGEAISLEVSQ